MIEQVKKDQEVFYIVYGGGQVFPLSIEVVQGSLGKQLPSPLLILALPTHVYGSAR
jgi:hypothetical protein